VVGRRRNSTPCKIPEEVKYVDHARALRALGAEMKRPARGDHEVWVRRVKGQRRQTVVDRSGGTICRRHVM